MKITITIEIDDKELKNFENHEVEQKDDRVKECSDYARFFDEECANWTNDPESNLIHLRKVQQYANELLKCKGFMFLNDVYDLLGIPKSKAGQLVGWIYDLENPNAENYIDFGIYNTNSKQNVDAVNGRSKTILLDFNVDGVIIDRI